MSTFDTYHDARESEQLNQNSTKFRHHYTKTPRSGSSAEFEKKMCLLAPVGADNCKSDNSSQVAPSRRGVSRSRFLTCRRDCGFCGKLTPTVPPEESEIGFK